MYIYKCERARHPFQSLQLPTSRAAALPPGVECGLSATSSGLSGTSQCSFLRVELQHFPPGSSAGRVPLPSWDRVALPFLGGVATSRQGRVALTPPPAAW